jgi:preprotein translocase SecF subunit
LKDRVIPFLKHWHWAYGFSISLFIVFIAITMLRGGFKMGVDFVGGMKMIVKFDKGVHEDLIRNTLKDYGPTVQQIGEPDANQYVLSTKLKEDSVYMVHEKILDRLEQKYPKVEIIRDDIILLSLARAADEGAVRANLTGMDAVLQRIGDKKQNEYVIYKKETRDKKTNYSANAVVNSLRNGFKNIDILSGLSIIALFDKPVDEANIIALGKEYGISVVRTAHTVKQGYAFSKIAFDESEKIKSDLTKAFKKIDVMSVENVGPAVGSYLRQSALKLVLMAIGLMTIYLAYRFELRYAVGAMVALLHDIMLATAFCGVVGIEFNIPIIAALLTIFGYSVHDTIIIFDRIRENTRIETKMSFIDVIDKAITQTLSRTIITVLLTLFSVIALWLLGGEGISDFALVLLFGFVIGSYSSIYQAAPVVLWWEKLVKKVRA